MTLTVLRSTSSSQPPATQNTAPVVEFRCLYTHDLRRKAKRWQDGFLRYHTFNRRIMVYDVSRNFIGDTYNQSGVDLQEGDDLELEKDFALVQVSEPVCITQTDLTELIQSRHKRDRTDTVRAARQPPSSVPSPAKHSTPCAPANRHRSLLTLLGTPKGALGKAALPTTSPFEEKQKRKAHSEHRPSKRTKVEASPQQRASRSLFHGDHVTGSHSKGLGNRQKRVIDLCSDDTTDVVIPTASPVSPITMIPTSDLPPQSEGLDVGEGGDTGKMRKPVRVISNAPRKMLLCQQPQLRQQPSASITTETRPLDPHEQRLQARLAIIGKKSLHRDARSTTPEGRSDAARFVAQAAQPPDTTAAGRGAGSD
ncbi:hypothetical protein ANO11243_051950 [Dothideomycetidae sp. 11243]|nr:hypothetical protein ANO11243_051950 [fungal sp. No.11243]